MPRENKLKAFFQKYRKVIVIAAPILLLLIISGVIWFAGSKKKAETPAAPEPVVEAPKPTTLPSLLNGVTVAADVANRHVVAVMIENSQPARPQVGLTSADVVYEAVTEGGITRFMGLFQQTYPDKAGPVRSARSYFIDWLSDYDAFYAHIGGSPTALSRISSYGIKDAGPLSSAYHREAQKGVASEHTAFVNVAQIYKIGVNDKKWPATLDFPAWSFKDPSAAPASTGPITINFSSTPFQVKWVHDLASNEYSRSLAGSAHKDRVSGEQIKARTIATMNVTHSANGKYKDSGHEAEWTMATTGSGSASVFQDGGRIDGTWKKPSRTERLRFYDSAGKEISLNRGKIWVEVIPQEGSITVAPAS